MTTLLMLRRCGHVTTTVARKEYRTGPCRGRSRRLLGRAFKGGKLLRRVEGRGRPRLLRAVSPRRLRGYLGKVRRVVSRLPDRRAVFRLLRGTKYTGAICSVKLSRSTILPDLELTPCAEEQLDLLEVDGVLSVEKR